MILDNPPVLTRMLVGIDYVQVRSKVTVVITAKTSTKILPQSTATVTSTTVSTSTSTVVPSDVSKTLSFSTTIPVTVTTTFYTSPVVTTTTTFTVSSTLTGYAACATNNLLGPVYNGNIIDDVYFGGNIYDDSTTPTNSAYDCCVACLTSETCSGSSYETNSGTCYQYTARSCANGQIYGGSFTHESNGGSNTGFSFVISNSNCGFIDDGGVAPAEQGP
jgi:hypothetical protein